MPYPPRRTRHVMRTEIEVGDREVSVEIEFSYYPGAPARFTPWPGDPPEPADVDLIGVTALEGIKPRPLTAEEDDAFDAWWWSRGEERAAEHAAESVE